MSKRLHEHIVPRLQHIDRALFAIIVLAALLRMFQPGLFGTWIDELLLTENAMQLARNGEWTWISNPTSFAPIPAHSPFTIYLTALPFFISPSWMVARLFTGLLSVLTIIAFYFLLKRYSGRPAALIGATLLTVMPLAVDWGRYIWNPNYTPVFLVLWMRTGLMGYHEGKRGAQIWHWIMLSAVIQTQTALILLVPLSIFLVLYRFWFEPQERRGLVWTTLIAFVVTGITLVPWGIGIRGIKQGTIEPDVQISEFRSESFSVSLSDYDRILQSFGLITSSTTFRFATLEASDNPARWWPDQRLNWLLWLQAATTGLGLLWAIQRGLQQRDAFPGLWLSMVAVSPFAYFIIQTSGGISNHYLMPTTYAGIAVLVLFLARLWAWKRQFAAIIIVFVLGQLWLTLAIVDWQQRDSQVMSMSELETYLSSWADNYGDILILEASDEEPLFTQIGWELTWNIFREQYPLRYVSNTHAFPVAADGQVLVSLAGDETIPTLFGEGDIVALPKRELRYIPITQDDLPQPNFIPKAPYTFADFVQVDGIVTPEQLEPDAIWNLMVLWKPLQVPTKQYQFSIRLTDTEGNGYGQVDGESLQPELWRVGDQVVTRLAMQTYGTLPDPDTLRFDIFVYPWPEMGNLPVFDAAGTPVHERLRLAPK